VLLRLVDDKKTPMPLWKSIVAPKPGVCNRILPKWIAFWLSSPNKRIFASSPVLEKVRPGICSRVMKEHYDIDCIVFNSCVQHGIRFSVARDCGYGPVSGRVYDELPQPCCTHKIILPYVLKRDRFVALIKWVHITINFWKHAEARHNNNSGLAVAPLYSVPRYSSSEAAIHAFVLCIREELRESNIKVMEMFTPVITSRCTSTYPF
jgi:short-subunit dehydrogenase involved in D-alanine esterification of teichoic acids